MLSLDLKIFVCVSTPGTLSAFIASVIVLFGDISLINANDSFYCHLIKVFWISHGSSEKQTKRLLGFGEGFCDF